MPRKSRRNRKAWKAEVSAAVTDMALADALFNPGRMPAAAYARLSVEEETDESILTQIAILRQYIDAREDMYLYGVYSDV